MKNKFKLTALASFLFIGTASFGQSLNISAGYTMSSIKGEEMVEYDFTESYGDETYSESLKFKNLHGFNVSAGYEFRLGERLSLETGIRYQTRGQRFIEKMAESYNSESYQETNSYNFKMNYLDIPIVLNTAILMGDFRVYARTGFYVGYKTGEIFKTRSEYSFSDGDKGLQESSESFSGADLEPRITGGLLLGVGAEYKNFFLESNYNMGLYSLEDHDDKEEVYTRDLLFSVGYKFKF